MAEQLPIKFEFWGDQTFADFFPADNQHVVSHLRQTVNDEGENYIFLWGESGHGKTHLLHACCHEAHNSEINCFYMDLARELLTTDSFHELENIELVCLDNLQAVCGREEFELALFNFFNRHRDHKHRLIIAANAATNALKVNLPDLKTRLNWGLALKIQALHDDDKLQLLTFKAQKLGFEMSEQCARFLLTHYDRRLTALWSALDKLDWASLAAQRKLTVPFLKQVLAL